MLIALARFSMVFNGFTASSGFLDKLPLADPSIVNMALIIIRNSIPSNFLSCTPSNASSRRKVLKRARENSPSSIPLSLSKPVKTSWSLKAALILSLYPAK